MNSRFKDVPSTQPLLGTEYYRLLAMAFHRERMNGVKVVVTRPLKSAEFYSGRIVKPKKDRQRGN